MSRWGGVELTLSTELFQELAAMAVAFRKASKSWHWEHWEWSQPSFQKHLGLLNKKKDYKLRANDYWKSKNTSDLSGRMLLKKIQKNSTIKWMRGTAAPHPLQHLKLSVFWILLWVWSCSHYCFYLHFLHEKWCETSFYILIWHLWIFFGEIFVHVVSSCTQGLLFSYCWVLWSVCFVLFCFGEEGYIVRYILQIFFPNPWLA